MKILLDVKDDEAPYLVKMLKGMKYVKTTTISPAKALLLKEIKEAVNEINLVKQDYFPAFIIRLLQLLFQKESA